MTDTDTQVNVTDDDIQEIVRENEAGVADLLDAYEPIEEQYFSVVAAARSSVTYSTNTTGS
jgi:hypothetical protein